MNKLFIILLLIIFGFLNHGYCHAKPILVDSTEYIYIQNSWIRTEIFKETGEISSLHSLHNNNIKNLLTKPASIIIRDKRDSRAEYRLSEGKVVKISINDFPDSVQIIFKINFRTIPPLTESSYSIEKITDEQGRVTRIIIDNEERTLLAAGLKKQEL